MKKAIDVMVMCQTCSNYYRYDDDIGESLAEGCKLDLPLFHPYKAIICCNYISNTRRVE